MLATVAGTHLNDMSVFAADTLDGVYMACGNIKGPPGQLTN